MEMRSGYKKTEVGVIPEGWDVKTIDSIALVTSGKRLPLGKSLSENETPHPYIRVTDMRPGTVSTTDLRFVPTDVFPAIKRYRIFKEDIFISVAGTLGIVGKIPHQLDGANLTENADRITSITCSQDYLLHVLMSPLIQKTIESLQTVGAQPKLALARIRKFDIPLPPIKIEQEAIAEALSDADDLIESLDQLIAKKLQIKQGAMQELLTGKRRLQGFSGEWEVKRLADVGECLRGVTYKGDSDLWSHDTTHTTRLLRSNNVQNSTVVIDEIQFVNSNRVAPQQLLRPRDILICMANGSKSLVGKAGLFNVVDGCEYTFGAFMGCFRTKTIASNPVFVFYLFQTARYREYINNLLAGSTINNLNPGSIESLEFHLPEMTEQTAIATILSDMDTELTALESRIAKARQIKQGMMQELLTGRIRLV